MADRILFLDDDYNRHSRFRRKTMDLGYNQTYTIVQVESAADAIKELEAGGIVQAFLDHDLSEEDVLVEVGQPTKVLTGMAVVDHICKMENPPATVVVHSMNPDAADEMCRRLTSLRTILVHKVPFSILMANMVRMGPIDG